MNLLDSSRRLREITGRVMTQANSSSKWHSYVSLQSHEAANGAPWWRWARARSILVVTSEQPANAIEQRRVILAQCADRCHSMPHRRFSSIADSCDNSYEFSAVSNRHLHLRLEIRSPLSSERSPCILSDEFITFINILKGIIIKTEN